MLTPPGHTSSTAVIVRTSLCLVVLLATSTFAGETGHTAYAGLNYPVLIYAGLVLPWPAVAGLTLCAAIGPNPHGSTFITTFQDDRAILIRPVALSIVAATAVALAKASHVSEETLRASEGRLFSFLESMPIGVFVLSAGGEPYYANRTAEKLLGQGVVPGTDTEEMATVYRAYVTGTDDPYPESRMPAVRALAGETSVAEDMEIEREDGRINLQVWGAPIRDESGKTTHAVAAFSNITAQKRFEAALQESEARFRAVFEEGPLGIAIVDLDYHYIQVNQALCNMLGYRGDEFAGLTFADITHPDDREIHVEQTGLLERGELQVMDVEKRYVRKDGVPIWVRVCVRQVRNNTGEPAYYLTMVLDITERRKALEEVERMAYHDVLTGLPNRRLMIDRLGQAIARAKRYEGSVVVLSIDLDGFKLVNDKCGHAAGDAVLVETGKRLRAALRDTDTVARMGGDEFLLLVTDASGVDADIVCQRIEASLSEPVLFKDHDLHVRASIGRATLFADGDTEDALISAADAAMYRDKEARRSAAL